MSRSFWKDEEPGKKFFSYGSLSFFQKGQSKFLAVCSLAMAAVFGQDEPSLFFLDHAVSRSPVFPRGQLLQVVGTLAYGHGVRFDYLDIGQAHARQGQQVHPDGRYTFKNGKVVLNGKVA